MTDIQELEHVVSEELNKGSFKSGGHRVSHIHSGHYFSASTHLGTRTSEYGFNPDYDSDVKKDPKPVLKDLASHEKGHHGEKINGVELIGVPGDIETSENQFYAPIFSTLRQKGFSTEDMKYEENAIEDTLLHAEGTKARPWDGMPKYFESEALASLKSDHQGWGDYYEAHVKLNMFLWGNRSPRRMLSKLYKNDPKVKEVLENFLKRTGISDMTQEISIFSRRRIVSDGDGKEYEIDRSERKIKVKDRKKIRDHLMNKDNWQEISRIHAEEFSKLMTPGYARGLPNHSGAGTKGRETEDSSEEGNVFQKERTTDKYREGKAFSIYKSGEDFPEWMAPTKGEKTRCLDLIYQRLAREISIRAETRTHPETIPIFYFGSRKFDPLTDSPRHLVPKVNDRGKLEWHKRIDPYELVIPVTTGTKSFPKAKFVKLDMSISMTEDPEGGRNTGRTKPIPWGDNSKYHYALLGWYGFWMYLSKNGLLLNKKDLELHGFSAGEKVVSGLDSARELSLNPNFGNDTRLNQENLRRVFERRDNLVMLISDGEIGNWDKVQKIISDGVDRNYLIWLQIGNWKDYLDELNKRERAFVAQVQGYNDLPRKTIDLTRKLRFGVKK